MEYIVRSITCAFTPLLSLFPSRPRLASVPCGIYYYVLGRGYPCERGERMNMPCICLKSKKAWRGGERKGGEAKKKKRRKEEEKKKKRKMEKKKRTIEGTKQQSTASQ